jgi:hypothetical protein
MSLFVTLPCKPVVKQYLINKYGEQCILPEGDFIKNMLLVCLQRNTRHQDSKITLQYYTETINLPINFEIFDRYGTELSKTSIRNINSTIEDIIHQRLYQHLEFYRHVAGYQLKDAIAMFQQLNNFPEDVYPAATITKYYQRSILPYLNLQKFVGVNVLSKTPKRKNKVIRENLSL